MAWWMKSEAPRGFHHAHPVRLWEQESKWYFRKWSQEQAFSTSHKHNRVGEVVQRGLVVIFFPITVSLRSFEGTAVLETERLSCAELDDGSLPGILLRQYKQINRVALYCLGPVSRHDYTVSWWTPKCWMLLEQHHSSDYSIQCARNWSAHSSLLPWYYVHTMSVLLDTNRRVAKTLFVKNPASPALTWTLL